MPNLEAEKEWVAARNPNTGRNGFKRNPKLVVVDRQSRPCSRAAGRGASPRAFVYSQLNAGFRIHPLLLGSECCVATQPFWGSGFRTHPCTPFGLGFWGLASHRLRSRFKVSHPRILFGVTHPLFLGFQGFVAIHSV